MRNGSQQGQFRALLSDLLAYPAGDVGALARSALAIAEGEGEGGAALARFAAAAGAMGTSALQELYTATFDLQPVCTPYVGVHLLGDDNPKRGALLAELVGIYAEAGYRPREELADHVAEVLGYMAVARPGPARDDLLHDGLLPALARMIDALRDRENPYRDLLVAVRELTCCSATVAAEAM
jgi:nitrate reductase delta subunit